MPAPQISFKRRKYTMQSMPETQFYSNPENTRKEYHQHLEISGRKEVEISKKPETGTAG
jgi:hypothetical protein